MDSLISCYLYVNTPYTPLYYLFKSFTYITVTPVTLGYFSLYYQYFQPYQMV